MQINQIVQKKIKTLKSITDELIKLKKIYDAGTIHKKEFNIVKKIVKLT